jgi:hypothetical protein
MASLPVWVYSGLGVAVLVGWSQVMPTTPKSASPVPGPAPDAARVASSASPGITFDAMTPLLVEHRLNHVDLTTTVFLRNDTGEPHTADLSLVLVDVEGREFPVTVTPVASLPAIQGHSMVPAALAISTGLGSGDWPPLPLRGYICLSTPGVTAAPVYRDIRILAAVPSVGETEIVLGSLAVAFLIVWSCVMPKARRQLLTLRMGSPTWGESWGSNLTVGTALLTALLGLSVFPEQTRFLPKGAYIAMSALFTSLIALAPVVYGLFRTPVTVMKEGVQTVQYQGSVGIFCLAASLTMWGALGQLVALGYVIEELAAIHVFGPSLEAMVLLMTVTLIVLLIWYALVSTRDFLVKFTAPQALASGTQPVRFAHPTAAERPGLPLALPEWHLL